MPSPTLSVWLDGDAARFADAPAAGLGAVVVVVNAAPATAYRLVRGGDALAEATSSEGGLLGFSRVDLGALDGVALQSGDGTFPLVGGGPRTSFCDLQTWSASSADGAVDVHASLYRPYCDVLARLEIVGSSKVSNANGACRRAGFNGNFNMNGQPVYTWIHYGDPESTPSNGGGNLADCDGVPHGYTFWPYLDCGVGNLNLMYYADYGVVTDTAQTGGAWPSAGPCLPAAST